MKPHIQFYQEHKSRAKKRGISFDLTFEQWLDVWGDKIEMRGRRKGQFGMLRIRDEGGYSIGNVYIGTPQQNHQERSVALKVRRSQSSASTGGLARVSYSSSGWASRGSVFDEYTEEDEENEETC